MLEFERVFIMSKYNYKVLSVLDSFRENGFVYKVFDVEDNIRQLAFKSDEMPFYYLHSAIYKDLITIHQPIYEVPQKIFDLYGEYLENCSALVLGCAGCSIPRYFAIKYPNCNITGVEYSDLMISIAKKYFYIDDFSDRFNLIHKDAFEFVKHIHNRKFNMVFVDLFDNSEMCLSLFDDVFFSNLSKIVMDFSVTVFNLLDIPKESRDELFIKAKQYYPNVYMIYCDEKSFLVAAKGFTKEIISEACFDLL